MFIKKALYCTISICLFASCSSISTTQKRKKAKPTQVINNFKHETESIELDKVIQSSKVEKRTETFLKSHRSKKVNFWINYFTRVDKRGFQKHLNTGEKYKKIVEKIFEEHNLPKELYYVGIIESGYKNHARSHASAVGPWQFIKDTAKRYGLKIGSRIDERKNIYKSTHAAARYFQDLYNIFGSWELALAGYNAGEYGVIRRIRGANTRDYYKLSDKKVLPKETRHYVPKIIAAMTVAKSKHRYGIKVKRVYNNIFDNVKSYKVSRKTSLRSLAKRTGTSVKLIKRINHDLRTNTIPRYSRSKFEVFIPSQKSFKPTLTKEKIPYKTSRKRSKPQRITQYKVKKGDNLSSIARKHKTSLQELKRINKLKTSKIFIGQRIKIKSSKKVRTQKRKAKRSYASVKVNSKILRTKSSGKISKYKVQKGDNLYSIARKFHVSLYELKKLNRLKKTSIFIGQKLKVPSYRKVFHTVKSGDFLIGIAKRYQVSLNKIKTLNKMKSSHIYPGQQLIIKLNRL